MIRIAKIDDLGLVLEMANKFLENSPYKERVDEKVLIDLVLDIITSPGSIVILNDRKGFLAGKIVPFMFSAEPMATELGWWVDPKYRKSEVGKELLEAFEYWAKKKKCKLITMVSLDDGLGKFYERRGYTLHERAYLKEI